MISTPVKVERLERTDGYVVAVWRRLMLLVWRGPATAAGIERSHALFGEWSRGHPEGGAFLVVVSGERPGPPDPETRAAMTRTARATHPLLKGIATLHEAEGFIAASVRAVMTGLHPGGAPKIFRAAAPAAAWAAELLEDPGLTTAGLVAAISAAQE
jgi:hypothetical protein